MRKQRRGTRHRGCGVGGLVEGDVIQSWSSKMVVVGPARDELRGDNKGQTSDCYSSVEVATHCMAAAEGAGADTANSAGGRVIVAEEGYWIGASGRQSEIDVAVFSGIGGFARVADGVRPKPRMKLRYFDANRPVVPNAALAR